MSVNQIIINGISVDLKNIVKFLIRSEEPNMVVFTLNKTLSSQAGEILDSVLPENNTFEIKEDGKTIMFNNMINSIKCELTYNSHSDVFEERIVLTSTERLI